MNHSALPSAKSTVQVPRLHSDSASKQFAVEGFAYNLYQFKERFKKTVLCANNCKGVDLNAVVVGGTALAATDIHTALQTVVNIQE